MRTDPPVRPADNALQTFTSGVRSAWGPLTSELVAECRRLLQALLKASPSEPWLAALHANAPANEELYRDPDHGFVLLAHTEHAGLYRPPHDHGRGWVIYAVQRGESEMGTYARIAAPDGRVRLVKRDSTLVRPGEVQVYLPGDIHDTLCMTPSALLYRFTERDLRIEDRQEHQVTRYVDRDGVWTVGAA
jgi:predicted metal-dependent enzyme (double-stranded beta helix superfamily)